MSAKSSACSICHWKSVNVASATERSPAVADHASKRSTNSGPSASSPRLGLPTPKTSQRARPRHAFRTRRSTLVAARVEQFDDQRHFPKRMGGAGKTGVEGANDDLDAIEQRLGDALSIDILARDRAHRFVHRLIVVRGADDQIAHGDQIVVADFVLVDQRAARRLDDADAAVAARAGADALARQQIGIAEQIADEFRRVQHLDHPRPVIGQRRMANFSRPTPR